MNITDAHCHLDEDRFDADREETITRALAAGVSRFITVGTDIDSDKKAITLAEKYPPIYAAVGIHPNDSSKATEADFDRLTALAGHAKVVAIGETGLDFYRDYSPRETQIKAFQRHLEIARQMRLPIIIHTRQSTTETTEILKQWVNQTGTPSSSPGVIHCFSGDWPTAKQYLNLGFYLSFGGYIGYPRSHSLEVIRQVPLDKLSVETDAPFLPPQPF
ncbi:MAG: TatD family hydrolase, partial [Dehalococcoidales bacterium]|nr:TatD family hydrolase [Dehalococcoidales bacterium]